ncbi:MAG TPA: DNA-3-methyladenine glycosylase, partial [Thermoanaerobaculia bacterium]|nr:DNA-3-methyladenine glycosylase [Thermoanaerobaculia bacterium]
MPGFAAHPVLPLDRLLLPEGIPGAAAERGWFLGPADRVARRLLGSWLVRPWAGRLYGARIVEVEAYLGVGDAAAHSFGGRRTARVEPMYGPGGLLYVFAVYGMHWCANVVTRAAGTPQAVLIRAAEHPQAPSALLSGPAKFCRALGIVGGDSGRDLAGGGGWEIRPTPAAPRRIAASSRIGVDYAGEAAAWPL